MRLHEYEGADIFESMKIPVPRRGVAESVEDAVEIAGKIGYPVILKAQVLVGGRGLAGGVKTADTPEVLEELAGELFEKEIKGLKVRKIMVSEKVDIEQELYIGITIDGYSGRPVVVASTEGGVNIEAVAEQSPDKIASFHVDPNFGLYPYHARKLFGKLGLTQRTLISCADVTVKLYKIFTRLEALQVEINPLAVLANGGVIAVDSVLEIDNSALSRIRHPLPDYWERIENALERKGKEIGVTYVDLDGDIALISSGAGLGMASMDIIGKSLKPANFLETGGGITADLLYKCMDLVTTKKRIKAVFINIYGGINPIHEGAKGVVRFIKENNLQIPIVAKALGNHQEETWEILRSGGVHVVTDAATEVAVAKLVELVTP
jgi:succinyl-CoA synthetase beta subunit